MVSPPKYALIIGGTGFISQYCVEELHNAGFIVATMNRGSSIDLHGDKISHRFIINRTNNSAAFVNMLRASVNHFDIDAWDLVFDFICYDRPQAEEVCDGLRGICKLFVMISTDSIYEVCKRPAYLAQQSIDKHNADLTFLSTFPQLTENIHPTPHPGRREEDQQLLDISEKLIRKKDEYGYEKFLCENVFLDHASLDLFRHPTGSNYSTFNDDDDDDDAGDGDDKHKTYPFECIFLRLPDVTGERELPRNRHFQLQLRIQLGLPVYIDPDNGYDVDALNLPQFYDPSDDSSQQVNKMPVLPATAVKLSFVHAKDVSTAAIAAYLLQQSAQPTSPLQGTPQHGEAVKKWSAIKNSGINIGSLEQVTLLEYLYIIGNTLNKPVFVYSSSQGREKLLSQQFRRVQEVSIAQASKDRQMNDSVTETTPHHPSRIYPQSYSQLYLQYLLSSRFGSNRSNSSTTTQHNQTFPGIQAGRIDVRSFLPDFHPQSPTPSPHTPQYIHSQLSKLAYHRTTPSSPYRCAEPTCSQCEQYLTNTSLTRSQTRCETWQTDWTPSERCDSFFELLINKGYECDYSDSSSDSSDSSSNDRDSTSADDSDYDCFFQDKLAQQLCRSVARSAQTGESNSNIDPKRLTRKQRIGVIVRDVLQKQAKLDSTKGFRANTRLPVDTQHFDFFALLALLHRLETTDQCSYLPSVTQGPISVQKAIDNLPNWNPQCLYQWAPKQTLWYSYHLFANGLDADARNAIWKLDNKLGKYIE